jgi:hypothetical protein
LTPRQQAITSEQGNGSAAATAEPPPIGPERSLFFWPGLPGFTSSDRGAAFLGSFPFSKFGVELPPLVGLKGRQVVGVGPHVHAQL